MNELDLDATLRALIAKLAPEADLASLDPGEDLRDALDLDSMDYLNLVRAVKRELGVDIPEADYKQARSLTTLAAYVASRRGG
ncbi:MAG: acyl carrier protein [Deltaproteobacteria bacterium]|jgi:acyl carrier protein